jgi:hypothetical protein
LSRGLAVAEHFKMNRVSISYVFDNPLTGDTLTDTDEERAARRERGEEALKDVVSRLLGYVEANLDESPEL